MPEPSAPISVTHNHPLGVYQFAPHASASKVWQRVVRQTLEAVLFEGLVDCVTAPNNQSTSSTFYFGIGGCGYSCVGKRGGFGRVRLKIETLKPVRRQHRRVNLSMFLCELIDELPGDETRKQCFWDELRKTVKWSEWNERYLDFPISRRNLAFPQLEAALHEGHPYHPCFKARTGFTLADHQRFSPEAAHRIKLQWLAVPKSLVALHTSAEATTAPHTSTGDSGDFWARELAPEVLQTLWSHCNARGGNQNDYTFVPVHPWQWHNRLKGKLQNAAKPVLDLGQLGDNYLASQSLRTLLNVSDTSKANIKLPLDIVNTSSRRYLQSHGVDSAPAISRWLATLVKTDVFFQQHPLVVLEEYAGLRVLEELLYPNADPAVCQLGAVWRQSVETALLPGERALPMTALAVVEADGKPFIDEWVNRYGVVPWLQQLLETAVVPVWHLLVKHGVAVEAHAQNSILLHTEGWPVRLALRDFHESVEYVEDFLGQPGLTPKLPKQPCYAHAAPNEYYWMDSVEALRELYMDTLYVFHLAELAALCEEFYQLSEARFWRMVQKTLAAYTAGAHCSAERQALIGHNADSIRVESLLRKKLCPADEEYHHRVANPFSREAEQPAGINEAERTIPNERN